MRTALLCRLLFPNSQLNLKISRTISTLMESKMSEKEGSALLFDYSDNESVYQRQRPKASWAVVAATSAVLLACSLALNIALILKSHSQGAFKTDIRDASPAIHYGTRQFTGALSYNETSKSLFRGKDAEIEYFGYPSPEITEAWKQLLRGGFVEMSEEEARQFTPELTPLLTTGKYHFEPDVFHSLHCLNAVRLEVSKTLYNLSESERMDLHHHTGLGLPPKFEEIHMEHCMDRIRQALMCQGDMTPSPLYSWAGIPVALGKAGTHTCRKWEPLMEWMDSRKARGAWIAPL